MSDVCLLSGISGLSFDSTFLSSLLFFCLLLLLIFFPCLFFLLMAQSHGFFFQKILQYFSLRNRLFFGRLFF